MKPVDVKYNTYVNFGKEVNDKDPKFKVGEHVRISKYKKVFAKGYISNWSREVFVNKKIKNTVPWTYIINDLNGKEIIGTFYKKKLQKTNQEGFRLEISYTSYAKAIIIHLIAGLIKRMLYKNEPILS